MNLPFEPYKIKSIEPIRLATRGEREKFLEAAGYNPFMLNAQDITIDLLTDSGTSAMSARQWAGVMMSDDSYAGSRSFQRFHEVVSNLTGYKHIIPTHQGRAAERILFAVAGGKEKTYLSNSHFDSTKANIEFAGAKTVDLPLTGGALSTDERFGGNIDLAALEKFLKTSAAKNVPMVIMTVTNNTRGGLPVSLENLKATSRLCREHGVPLFIDACRFAENAFFIKEYEPGQKNRSVADIAREMFRLADGATMSGKKDGLVNMGGFLALNDDAWADKAKQLLILTEGFLTYGGMAGRDLEAMAIGLEEVLDEEYLRQRIHSIARAGVKLHEAGVPLMLPTGGHALFLDAAKFFPHVTKENLPGQTLSCALYLEGGIRGSEVNGTHTRLAFPRRVYTQSHIDYVCDVIIELHKKRDSYKGMKLAKETSMPRLTGRFEPVA